MGCIPCVPSQNFKNNKAHISTNFNSLYSKHSNLQEEEMNDKKKKIEKIKIIGSTLVQECSGHPSKHYEKIDLLGEGSFGEVFKVLHKSSKCIRAMKVINKIKLNINEEDEKGIINEITVLKDLDHPNILKVYEYFNTNFKLYIITELCTGGELFKKIVEVQIFSEKVAAHIMHQLLSAVRFCHSNNVIHRDLKPENILIDTEEERLNEYFNIKIIDFGTSVIFTKNKMLNKQIGTPFYIAPEVLEKVYNEKCDIWSCGVIMYILLSGTPPFYGDNDEEIYKSVKEGKLSLNDEEWLEKSEEAKDLLKCLLRKDYFNRLSADEALSHEWFKKFSLKNNEDLLLSDILKQAILNLKDYRAEQKLQQAALAFVVRNQDKRHDINNLRKLFIDLNEAADGHLTKLDLLKGMCKVLPSNEAYYEVERIMKLIDNNQNGFIEYEEFLRACINKEKILTEESLLAAFKVFDKDGSGSISAEELKNVLSPGATDAGDDVWKYIIKEFDPNGEGEISFCQFQKMMLKIILKNEQNN